jgi:hypothetical protein
MGYGNEFDCQEDGAREAREPAQRLQRMLNVAMRGRRFGGANAIVRNISPRGLGGTTKQWLVRGEQIQVELPNLGPVPATVIWTDGIRFGARFCTEIDAGRVTRDSFAGMDQHFRVMDRFRPEPSMKRPAIGLR